MFHFYFRRKFCMNNVLVRIKNIEISNFKNTKHGCVDLENKKSQFRSSVLALYGQNGSGKTSLINALELLKNILTLRSRF